MRAAWISMGWSWQFSSPSPAFVQRMVVSQMLHSYRLPSWLAIRISRYFGSTGWPSHVIEAAPPLVTMNSAPQTLHTNRFPVLTSTMRFALSSN